MGPYLALGTEPKLTDLRAAMEFSGLWVRVVEHLSHTGSI